MKHTVIVIALSAVITLIMRAFPFVIFNGDRKMPQAIEKLGGVLPSTIMAVLIIYCLKGSVKEPVSLGIPGLIGVLVVGVTYKWKHSTFISILVGTMVYMALLAL